MARWKSLDIERIAETENKTVLYRLAGRLSGTKECYELLEMVRDDVHVGHFRVILNLADVNRVSSPGIGILAASYTSITNAGGTLMVVAVPKAVRQLLEMVRLWNLLVEFETEAEALVAARTAAADPTAGL
jgi:anti-anti-sigma factor